MGATVTSFYFLCFLLGILILYYIVPHRFQWLVLLVSSIAYYLLAGNGILIVYPLVTGTIAYLGARYMDKSKAVFPITVAAVLLPLFALKYINFLSNTVNGITDIFEFFTKGNALPEIPGTTWLVPLGISFYTFSVLGYVIDVHNQIAKPQTNLLKFLTFGMYFPVVLSGPLMKYREDGEQFFEPHKFDYHNITFGAQRMLWGFFKTLVISERAGKIVSAVYGSPDTYPGIYVIYATFCFAINLYTNFSGCMDIVLGMSEMFGLKLPENFDRPFFSKSISEYWRRWHITLGVWMKEYVFYPLLRTRFFMNMQSRMKEKHGKKKGKQLTTFAAMFILWFTVGVWHGGEWKYVIGSGLLHWFYIVFGELTEPVMANWMEKLHINAKAKWMDNLRCIRTFILVCIGFVFFRADSVKTALSMLGSIFVRLNAGSFASGGIFELGLNATETIIMFVSVALLFTISLLQEKDSVRKRVDGCALPIRWIIWYGLLFITIIFGYYGPGFDTAEFIYQGF